jgi:hypothetical protein
MRRVAGPPVVALLLAAPVVVYFLFIAVYGVNTIVLDQWSDVAMLEKFYAGHGGLDALWTAHNENRLLFPNLVVVALDHLTHLDTLTESYLGALMLCVTAALVVVAHRRGEVRPPAAVWYLPVPALLLTLAQYYNTLLGFQMAWYLALLALVVSLVLLDRAATSWAALGTALVAAVLSSYSTFEGLLVWPAGLTLLLLRRAGWPRLATWLAAAIATVTVYFRHLALGTWAARDYDLHHPLALAGFFLMSLGDVLGFPVSDRGGYAAGEALLIALGAVVLLVAGAALVRGVRLCRPGSSAPLGCALIVAGLAFAAVTSLGRGFFGLYEASASRFVTFDVLPMVGSYLVYVSVSAARQVADPQPASTRGRGAWPRALVLVVAVLPAAFGLVNGLAGGNASRAYAVAGSDVVVNIGKATDSTIEWDVYPLADPALVRRLVGVARAHRLSLFDTQQVVLFEKRGLHPGPPIEWPHR